MTLRAAIAVLACFVGLAGCSRDAVAAPAGNEKPAAGREAGYRAPDSEGWGSAAGLEFLELVTPGASRTDKLPMFIIIHGMGDKPSSGWIDGFDFGRPARVIMPRALEPYHGGFSWFAYRARDNAPDALARGIAHAAERISALLQVLPAQRPTEGRPIVLGFSQGGMLSFALALRYPERLRFALPISGILPEPLWPKSGPKGARIPIRALHGTADDLVPYAPARELVQHLSALGYDASLEAFEGAGHTIDARMQTRANALLSEALTQTR